VPAQFNNYFFVISLVVAFFTYKLFLLILSAVEVLLNDLRRKIFTTVENSSTFKSLAQLCIELWRTVSICSLLLG